MKKFFSKVKRLYYEVWSDYIDAANKNTKSYMSHNDKMFFAFIGFTLAQGANLLLLLLLLEKYFNIKKYLPEISFDIFPGNYLDGALGGIVMFFLPFAIPNYFLVFYKKTYLKYMENRKINTKGMALAMYLIISLVILFLFIGIEMFLSK